jgi:hypothetical protein
MTIHDDEINGTMLDTAIDILRRETQEAAGPVAVSLDQLHSELGELAPATAAGLLDLVAELIADPRIDSVAEEGMPMIEFAWVGEKPAG